MAVQQKLFLLLITLATTVASKPAPNCSHPQVCGSLTIPYPFGTTPDCYLNEKFFISCDQTHTPPKPLLSRSNVTVLNISLDGELRVLGPIARACYNKFGKMTTNKTRISSMFSNSNFPISTKNKFTAVGCDTIGLIKFAKGKANIRTSCASYCDQETREVVNGSCSGVGCCQMPIIQEIWNYETEVRSVTNHSEIHDVNPCDYAFVVEEGSYNFSALDLKDNLKNIKSVPVLLDWAIVDKTCEKAKENVNTYACPAKNSQCVNSTNGHGYRCHCGHGYQGNPYLVDGCQDINECKYSHLNTCLTHLECVNTEGSYICKRGKKKPQLYLKLIIAISSALGAFLLLVVAWGLYKIIKKRIDDQRKERFFKRNGGLLLQQQLSSKEINVERVKLFNFEELEKSTDHFNANRILGQGSQGTVYKGMLADGKIVAIKKSKLENNEEGKIPECKLSEFINEVIILSQINHRNVVKLMGCCLESEVPLLVYEFILNGTLYQYIHDHQNEEFPLTWKVRLRISLEIGSALSYLHSAASFPIYHRDIKSSNILLDEKYRAKIADFGTSRSVHIEQTHLTTQVKGTFGYFDPEYFQSSQFTEKSDVYSFGVVMLELLTGQKPISRTRSKDGEESRSLTTYFLLCMEQNCLFDIVDPRIIEVGESQDQIIKVAHLAKRCLNLNGKNRPTMKEVAMELEEIQNSTKNFVNQQSFIERVENEETKTTGDANSAPLWSSSFTTTAASLDALPILKTF